MKYAIRMDPIWRPFMLFLAATPENSYVEMDDVEIRLRFGRAFQQAIARENVVGAERTSWSFFNGLGIIAGGQVFGLIGSTAGVVELRLRDAVPMRFAGWSHVVRRIAVSLEDPQALIDALNGAAAADETPQAR
jgi:hypothetical protein